LPKWQGTDGLGSQLMNYDRLLCWKNVHRYALLNERVLQVAKRELKELCMILANVMFILSSPKAQGRTVEMLRFKLFRKNHERQNDQRFTFGIDSAFSIHVKTTTKPKMMLS
jgi:selenocysteine-specific translation elongation factor